MPGYYGFPSRKAYEEHYSDPAKYADEIPAMEEYAREAAFEQCEHAWTEESVAEVGDRTIKAVSFCPKCRSRLTEFSEGSVSQRVP